MILLHQYIMKGSFCEWITRLITRFNKKNINYSYKKDIDMYGNIIIDQSNMDYNETEVIGIDEDGPIWF